MADIHTNPLAHIVKMLARSLALGTAVAAFSTGVAVAQDVSTQNIRTQVKYDKKIAEAARKRAAEKVGDLRGGLSSDDLTTLVQKDDLKAPSASPREDVQEPISIRRRSWNPKNGTEKLPPMVFIPVVDTIKTGTVRLPGRHQKLDLDAARKLNPFPE